MKLKIFLGLAILLSLCVQVHAQSQSARVICTPGTGADSIKVQYSTSATFSTILGESAYKKAGVSDTCDCSVPKVEGLTYYFRCVSKNPAGICVANIKSITIPVVTPPSGCSTGSVTLIP